jgi:hypothetical protein
MDELKDQLRRRRDEVRPDPGAFERLIARRRRRDALRRGTVIAVAFSITIAGSVLVLQAFGGGARRPAASVTATPQGIVSPPPARLLHGAWSTTLTNAMPGVRPQRLAGTYRLTFGTGGSLNLQGSGGAIPSVGRQARGSFRIVGGGFQIATNLLASVCGGSTGTYSWTEHVGHLTLAVVNDSCTVRRTLFSSSDWNSA